MVLNMKLFQTKHLKNSKILNKKQQVIFFQEMGELLQSGYSLSESIEVLTYAHHDWSDTLQEIDEKLCSGYLFYRCLANFVAPDILLQLKLSQNHGNLPETLIQIGRSLGEIQRHQNKIKQIMKYPLLLFVILSGMLLGIKFFLYPILEQWHTGVSHDFLSISYSFKIVIILLGFLLITCIFLWQHLNTRQQLFLMIKIPVVGKIIQTMITYHISQQLSSLLSSGLQLSEVLDELVEDTKHSNLPKIPVAIIWHAQSYLKKGYPVEKYILEQPYINKSLAGYFSRGHSSRLVAKHLSYFSKTQFNLLIQKIDTLINIIQPVCFGVIGLSIIGVYLSMLLPMYQSIGGLYQ